MRIDIKVPLRPFSRQQFTIGLGLLIFLAAGCSLASMQQLSVRDQGSLGSTHAPPEIPPGPELLPPPLPATSSADMPIESRDLDNVVARATEARGPHDISTFLMFDFPVDFNPRVRAKLNYYQRYKAIAISRAFARARRYAGMMRAIFREKGLPQELVNLAFVESEANPRATSHANAAGIWQFIPSTARLYGMRTSSWLDERRDPEKSTRAAAGYLEYLYGRFQSWPLALAAYNAGEAPVRQAIKRQRTRDYWRLHLLKETRHFVPSFMAMTLIARDPERYGFSPPPDEPYDTEHLHVAESTEIRRIAEAAGTSVKHLRELNPELVGTATPPDQPTYAVRIPRRVRWISHTVRKGETLAVIAERYRVSVQLLREMNDLPDREALRPGRVILVPTAPSSPHLT